MNQNDFRQLLASSSVRRTPNSGGNNHEAASSASAAAASEAKKSRSKKGKAPPKGQQQDGDGEEETDEQKQRKLLKEKYRDRAKERREQKKDGGEEDGKGEPEITEEQMAQIDYGKSKYLGGDQEHTHLVKGLDFKLAERVRREQQERQQQKHQEQEGASHSTRQRINKGMQEAMGMSRVNRPVQFNTHLGSTIYRLVNETLSDKARNSGLGVTKSGRGHEDRFLPGSKCHKKEQ